MQKTMQKVNGGFFFFGFEIRTVFFLWMYSLSCYKWLHNVLLKLDQSYACIFSISILEIFNQIFHRSNVWYLKKKKNTYNPHMIQKFWCPTGDKSDTISEKWSFSHSLFFSNENSRPLLNLKIHSTLSCVL